MPRWYRFQVKLVDEKGKTLAVVPRLRFRGLVPTARTCTSLNQALAVASANVRVDFEQIPRP